MNIDLNNEEQLQALLRQLIAQKETGHPGVSLAQDDDEENSGIKITNIIILMVIINALQDPKILFENWKNYIPLNFI